MSLQGHEKAARIISEAMVNRAEEITGRAKLEPAGSMLATAMVHAAVTLGQLALVYADAAASMEAEIRAEAKS